MEKVKIKVNLRESKGKEAANRLRKEGNVPAVVYGGGVNIALSVPSTSLKMLKAINFAESTIINMEIQNKEKKENISVLIKDIQSDPLTEKILHIDFLKVSLKEKIKVHVPIILTGEAKGVKEEGILEQLLRELEVEGLPLDIPEKIEVDITDLGISHSIHVSNLAIPDNLKVLTDTQSTVVTVVAKKEEAVEEDVVEEASSQGPDVIKEKKETSEKTGKE